MAAENPETALEKCMGRIEKNRDKFRTLDTNIDALKTKPANFNHTRMHTEHENTLTELKIEFEAVVTACPYCIIKDNLYTISYTTDDNYNNNNLAKTFCNLIDEVVKLHCTCQSKLNVEKAKISRRVTGNDFLKHMVISSLINVSGTDKHIPQSYLDEITPFEVYIYEMHMHFNMLKSELVSLEKCCRMPVGSHGEREACFNKCLTKKNIFMDRFNIVEEGNPDPNIDKSDNKNKLSTLILYFMTVMNDDSNHSYESRIISESRRELFSIMYMCMQAMAQQIKNAFVSLGIKEDKFGRKKLNEIGLEETGNNNIDTSKCDVINSLIKNLNTSWFFVIHSFNNIKKIRFKEHTKGIRSDARSHLSFLMSNNNTHFNALRHLATGRIGLIKMLTNLTIRGQIWNIMSDPVATPSVAHVNSTSDLFKVMKSLERTRTEHEKRILNPFNDNIFQRIIQGFPLGGIGLM